MHMSKAYNKLVNIGAISLSIMVVLDLTSTVVA